jgi:hypothetical protein
MRVALLAAIDDRDSYIDACSYYPFKAVDGAWRESKVRVPMKGCVKEVQDAERKIARFKQLYKKISEMMGDVEEKQGEAVTLTIQEIEALYKKDPSLFKHPTGKKK